MLVTVLLKTDHPGNTRYNKIVTEEKKKLPRRRLDPIGFDAFTLSCEASLGISPRFLTRPLIVISMDVVSVRGNHDFPGGK